LFGAFYRDISFVLFTNPRVIFVRCLHFTRRISGTRLVPLSHDSATGAITEGLARDVLTHAFLMTLATMRDVLTVTQDFR